jgi:hypoxanthine phosphoribosyltransferase
MNINLLFNALHDTYSDSQRRHVSTDELIEGCRKLAQIIKERYSPDILIAIESGGVTPGNLIAQY